MVLETLGKVKQLAKINKDNKSAFTYQPHLIIFYLRDLSQIFHSYYNDNHILSEEIDNQEFIINCMSSVRQIISNGLNLLGISPMQKM